MSLKQKKSIDNIWPMANKKVLVRVDFNVPIKNGEIKNDYRVRSALPTIKRIIDHGGICILMSHLGRPKGAKFHEVHANEDARKRALHTWYQERGTGKTTFFALLDGADKLKVLSWSTAADKITGMGAEEGAGKTALFSHLPEEEKKTLLDRFNNESRAASQFPQLRQYQGFEEELSLKPVAERLAELLGKPVAFAHDCMDAQDDIAKLKAGDVMLLENVRFYSDEGSKKDTVMAQKLASYTDYFVSDAFGTAHRDSATMTGIPKALGHGAAGYLMEREINYFAKVLGNPPRPMVAIVGGAKVSDKILLLENMLTRIDKLIIGGAMAYTFLKAKGFNIGKSFCEAGQSFTDQYGEKRDIVSLADNLLKLAAERNVEVFLPVDHVCHTECKPTDIPVTTEDANVPDGYMALDIGPKTIAKYLEVIKASKTAIWNGPMGVFEMTTYSAGTFAIAKAMGDGTEERGLLSIIGGGDSASAAEQSGHAVRMSHVSTGGGASLELLEGKILPGIAVLDDA
ncbi:phosphoglycerate kinase, putative [Bodo saltans]|uniref:Phosphoglycerate kinase n=1 Tax=Bodo saltans TaxID=75058 RepID=A0A0S4JE17_BODSA|nr:phosphoglycerate kinase, putative [Bodo saltans]|eukprot:CUG88283.1 phosphoglycerate kinase, putative [Bodo saltans]